MQSKTSAPLVIVCAWCQAEGKGPVLATGQSHGICWEHMREMLAEMAARTEAKP